VGALVILTSGQTTFKNTESAGEPERVLKRFQLAATLVCALFGGCLLGSNRAGADERFFREKVAPIFERHCVVCHQGDKPKGGLSLTTAQGLLAESQNRAVIEPGKPHESLLVEMISGDKPAMPQKAKPLSKQEIAAIRQWIADGAPWPADLALRDKRLAGADDDWWSLRPLVRPAVPSVASTWVRTPVDAFILAKLGEKNLAPSREAVRRTLIRRLTYDLHGLPPTPREMDDFLADKADDAYERLIDRLLDSPRYGERWGRHWLDVVHFGESHGYDKDKPRPNAWPYRDWVIAAFNNDMPYDQFVAQQLAGDVLSPDVPQGIVATGFIAAGPWDFVGHMELREGTVDKKIARSNDRDDMVATAMSTFQSLTVHCARCHNHKFDPIAQEDYYRLQAVFAGVDRFDRPFDRDREIHVARRQLLKEKEKLVARQGALAAVAAKITSPEIEKIDAESKELGAQLAGLPKPETGTDSSPTNGYHSDIMPQADAVKWVQVDLGRSMAIDEIVLIPARPTDFPDTPGFGFPLRFQVDIADDAKFSEPQTVAEHTAEDFASPGDKPVVVKLKEKKARYVRVTATRLWKRTDDYVFALAELQALSENKNVALGVAVTALDSIEAGRWSTKHLVDDYTSRARAGNIAAFQAALAKRQLLEMRIANLQARREAAVDERLDEATRTERVSIARRLAEIEGRLAGWPAPAMVYAAAHVFAPQGGGPNLPPRPVYFLHRGSDKTPGDEVAPGALSCLAGLPAEFSLDNPADEGSRRAALARWITDPKNPLTARSIVNRVWQYHFGRGIVDTPNDFGHMGALPTHPELLDWLAAELMEGTEGGVAERRRGEDKETGGDKENERSGGAGVWNLKRLHRLILRSAVYRQVSNDNAGNAAIDSGNQYLWRMNRQRLEAEALRDAVLAVSGKLDLTMGGPSRQQFFFKDDHSPVYDYERFDIDSPGSFRRSVYRFIVRSVPDPFMECLDCADPSLLTPKRNTTLTALQALSLLNNQFMVRQAEHFAARLSAAAADVDQQIALAYQLSFGRDPTADERRLVRDYVSKNGLASLCRVLFNSNEFLFVD
jgi:mono/diheme cytochrome c family protein